VEAHDVRFYGAIIERAFDFGLARLEDEDAIPDSCRCCQPVAGCIDELLEVAFDRSELALVGSLVALLCQLSRTSPVRSVSCLRE